MIHDVDNALRDLIRRDVLGGQNGVDIEFDAPTTDWAARQNSPTISVYLYDITENTRRREVMPEVRRDADGLPTHRQLPSRFYDLAYLITAWTQRPEDEHRLLSSLLAGFLLHPTMPDDVKSDAHAAVEHHTLLMIGLPRPEHRQAIDVWSSLGGELKPSLDLVVTVPLFAGADLAAGPPVMETPKFSVGDGDAAEDVQGRRRGGGEDEDGSARSPETVYGGRPPEPDEAGAVPEGAAGDGRPGRVVQMEDLPRPKRNGSRAGGR